MYNLDERVRRYRANDFRPEGDLAKKDTYDESYFADNVVVDSGTDENGNKVQTAILNSPTWNEAQQPQQTGSVFSNLADFVSNAWDDFSKYDAGVPANVLDKEQIDAYADKQLEDEFHPVDFVKSAIHESQYGTAIEHSKLYESYFRNRDDKNAEIARIASTLKISEDTFAHDQTLYQKAAEAADTVEKLKENKQFLDADGKVDMNKVYASVPGLLDVQQKYGSSAAALALANMDGLKSINDVYTNAAQQFLGSVWAGFERGVYTFGKNMRYAKAALFAEDLSDEDKKAVASYNKSLAAIPKYSFDTTAGAVGGMIGLAAENIVNFTPAQLAAGGASLAVGLGVYRFTHNAKAAKKAAAATRNIIGTLGIAAPILGQEYEEDTAKVDEYGRRVYTNEQARGMDIVKALFQGALEQWTLSDIGNAILGRKKAVSKAVADVITKSETEEAAKEGVRVVVLDRLKEMAAAGGKSFMSESREEFLQQASDMIVENAFQAGIYGKDADISSVGDILTQSTAAMIDAAPAILGFGIIGGVGNAAANTRGMVSLRERAGAYMNNRIYKSSVDSTHLADTIVGVQANMESIKELKDKAPEAATEILDKQNALMGIEETAVDVKSLAQSDAGLVNEIAKKAGISESELAVAMADESSGKIIVKTSSLMQMDMSDEQRKALHDNVSKTADAFTLKEINEKRRDAQKAMKELAAKAEDDYANVDKFVKERFTGVDDETLELARNIVFESNGNPARTYSERMRNTQQRIDALLSDAKDYLKNGMGQGVDIIATDEDGTPLADQRAVAGGYTRVSNNAEWYRNYFAENGKAPTAREIEDIAIAMVTGESNPYVPEEMRPQSEEMERSMKNSPEATELRELLKTREKLGKLGDTMKAIKPGEVELVSDLTDDGRKVYSVVMRELMQGNREVKKEALVGAILTARMAERIIGFHHEAGDTAYDADDFLGSRVLHANAVLNQETGNVEAKAPRREAKKALTTDEDTNPPAAVEDEIAATDNADKENAEPLMNANDESVAPADIAEPPKSNEGEAAFTGTVRDDEMTDEEGNHPEYTATYTAEWNGDASSTINVFKAGEGGKREKIISVPVLDAIDPEHHDFNSNRFKERLQEIYPASGSAEQIQDGNFALTAAYRLAKSFKEYYDFKADDDEVKRIDDSFNAAYEKEFNFNQVSDKKLMQAEKNSVDNEQEKADNEGKRIGAYFKYEEKRKIEEDIDNLFAQFDANVNITADDQEIDAREKLLNPVKRTRDQYLKAFKSAKKRYSKDIAYEELVRTQRVLDYERWVLTNDERRVQKVYGLMRGKNKERGTGANEKGSSTQFPADRRTGRNGQGLARKVIGIIPGYLDAHNNDPIIKKIRSEYAEQSNTQAEKHSENIQGAFSFVKKLFQTAWHGSAHDFDSFDLGKIGSGAGMQVHGWGLYFAKDRKISEDYKERLAAEQIENGGESKARLYEAEIPEDDVMLDENKSFDEQPPKVKKALKKLIKSLDMDNLWFDPSRLSDSEIAEKVLETFRESDGQSIYGTIADNLDGAKEASLALNKAGIKGIAYNEQGGRCYVVFDDKAVGIIEKYNQAANQSIQGRTDLMSNGKRMISIMETADESTFIHEMAHVFLMDLENLARMGVDISEHELGIVAEWADWHKSDAYKLYKDTPWYDEFRKREDAIIDAEQAGDLDERDKLIRVWKQERFARAFEIYMKEGKAPSKGLRGIFRKFRQFLVQIYRSFVSDGSKASPQVEAVMARMIATEDEIRAAELDDRYKDVTKAGGEKLFTETEEETYQRWHEEAAEEAKAKLMKSIEKEFDARIISTAH